MTSNIIHNATSSPGLQAGHLPCNLLDGQQTDLFGRDPAPASLSVLPDDKKVKQTRDIYGQYGNVSLASASLQQFLESKLQQQLPMGGLMMFMKGWKRKATPLGRLYFQLHQSVRPIKETGYGLWATPNTMDILPPRSKEAMKKQATTGGRKGRTFPGNLREQVDSDMCQAYREALLENGKSVPERPHCWPTPSSRDWKDVGDLSKSMVRKDKKLRNDTLGRVVYGSTVQTESKGSLNPALPCWLMGFSTESLSSMHSAMQSYRRSQQNLSKQHNRRINNK